MTYEYYNELANADLPERLDGGPMRIRLADHCTVAFANSHAPKEQSRIRERYTKGSNDKNVTTGCIENLYLPELLTLDKVPRVVSTRWHLLAIDFSLLTPWYSKDDRPFHVLDNPLRKDRVFGVPFVSAPSWKGLLHWASQMEEGLLEHLDGHGGQMEGWNEPAWIVHLFGNKRGEGEEFSRGALRFLPTWFNRIGFEVINPHRRETKAGTQPIVYEVVPAETSGKLHLLYAPAPGREGPPEAMSKLVCAIEKLLTVYGFSAKRTAGWGLAHIVKCELSVAKGSSLELMIGTNETGGYVAPSEELTRLMDESGRPIDVLLFDDRLISKTQFRKLGDRKPCTKDELESFRQWYATHGEEHERRLRGDAEQKAPAVMKWEFGSLGELRAALKEGESPRNGGDS